MYRWIGGITMAVMLLVVGVGCGSGESTSDITKAEFVKKANAICADYTEQRLAAAEKEYNKKVQQESQVTGSSAQKKLAAELEEIGEKLLQETTVPILRTQAKKLKALGAPSGDEETVEAMLNSFEKATDEVEKEGYRGAVGGNQYDQFEKEARTYGLKCKLI